MKAKLKMSVHFTMLTKYTILWRVNTGESREVKINFAWFTFVYYAGKMLFCVMNIFTSR